MTYDQGAGEEVRLPRREMVGDMGSIVFPASHVLVSWIKKLDNKTPGHWSGARVVGRWECLILFIHLINI